MNDGCSLFILFIIVTNQSQSTKRCALCLLLLSNQQLHGSFKNHSTKTALLKLKSDVLNECDKYIIEESYQICWYSQQLSTPLTIRRLQSALSVSFSHLNWFQSHMSERFSCVTVNGNFFKLCSTYLWCTSAINHGPSCSYSLHSTYS